MQRAYSSTNWGEKEIIRNVTATSTGQGVYLAAQQAAQKLGLTLKVLPDGAAVHGYTIINPDMKLLICVIPGNVGEGEATQILVQELSNAINKAQLDRVGSPEIARRVTKEQYVSGIEALEYPGALASRQVFVEAESGGSGWTQGGAARWEQTEVQSLDTYFEYLKKTNASSVYEHRWETANTYVLHREGDYSLFGQNLVGSNQAKIFLVHRSIKVLEGIADYSQGFGAIVLHAKLLFNAYVWKHTEG